MSRWLFDGSEHVGLRGLRGALRCFAYFYALLCPGLNLPEVFKLIGGAGNIVFRTIVRVYWCLMGFPEAIALPSLQVRRLAQSQQPSDLQWRMLSRQGGRD